MRRGLALPAIFALGCGLGCAPDREKPPPPQPPPPVRPAAVDPGRVAGKECRALLVGCTEYPGLLRSFWLEGPGNDVALMRRLLVERFGVPRENVRVLADGLEGAAGRPFRAEILGELERLAETAAAGDYVVIFLAGHGSRQPDDDPDNPADPEPDGFDEVFCPADVKRLESPRGRAIPNAITDDEIRARLGRIAEGGASVWIIVDACHSGTVMRGNGEEIDREIPAEALLPEVAVSVDASPQEESPVFADVQERGASAARESGQAASPSGSLVATYAAQPNEPTVEKALPEGDAGRKPHGLFTYTLVKVVSEADAPLSYRELVRRIHAQYVEWGRTGPTPLVEGPDRDREVLGRASWPERPPILLAREAGGRLRIDAGALGGMTPGTILAVHPHQAAHGAAGTPLGHVRTTHVRATDSDVLPCAFGDLPARDDLPAGAVCEVVRLSYGELALALAVDRAAPGDGEATAGTSTEAGRLAGELESLGPERMPLVRVVNDPADAAWLLRPRADGVWLIPAEGSAHTPGRAAGDLFGPVPRGEEGVEWLRDRLVRIARASNLLAIASASANRRLRGPSGSGVDVGVEMLRREGDAGQFAPVVWGPGGLVVPDRQVIRFRVENRGRLPADVTLLFVDSAYGITPVFPAAGTHAYNRLGPKETFETEPWEVTATTLGLEHLVLIAIRGSGPTADFGWLAQPTLERAGAAVRSGGDPTRDLDSPLGVLLQRGIFGAGQTRGLSRQAAEDVALGVLSWQTVGGKK